MNVRVFDIEANGFNPDKIHCLSVKTPSGMKSVTSKKPMKKFFEIEDIVFVGHNIQRYDIPVVERLLDVKVVGKVVDTLALSWYLFPNRLQHGLEAWGEEFGVPKPKVTDWHNLTPEEYVHRCEEDVKINFKLWEKCWTLLLRIYGNEEKAWKLIDYLTFKMNCARQQEELKWKLDVAKCSASLRRLTKLKEEKVKELIAAMPTKPIMKTKSPPAKPFKKDGSLSAQGLAWKNFLVEWDLPEDFKGEHTYISGWDAGNPNSVPQVKSWLIEHGWIPQTFKYKRNKDTNEFTPIPQINLEKGAGICPSIKKLYTKEPALELLDGLSVLTHRIGLLAGFMSNVDEEGYVQAQIKGLTNTLRFKHKVVVNLPGIDKPFGDVIRGCLTAPDGYELIGSDMSSLEDRTKQSFMWEHDPDFVTEMTEDGFDPHLKIGVEAGMITKDEEEFFKWYKMTH